MKFEIMERAFVTGGNPAVEKNKVKQRHGLAIAFTLGLHAALLSVFSFDPDLTFAIPEAPIPVKLVVLDITPPADTVEPNETAPLPEPKAPALDPLPKLEPEPETESVLTDPPLDSPQAEISPEPESSPPTISVPLSVLSTDEPKTGEPIPDRWRLPDGARIPLENTQQARNPNLKALSKSLDCLGFDADCAVQRKSVFAEDQLSGTDLVWMRSYAHSGLSDSSLYGLNEAQIRERLGIPTAGKNGLMIFPGIMIDGPWWDALHGVNKACDYGVGINDNGQKQLMKQCKPLQTSSKDRIAFKPKAVD